MKLKIYSVLSFLFLFTFKLTLFGGNLYEITEVPDKTDSKAPNFTFLDGGEKKFYDFIGDRIVVFNFWRTACSGCQAEMGDLNQLSQELDPNKYIVLGFCYDDKDVAAATINEWKIPFINFFAIGETEGRMAYFLNAPLLPQTVIIDPQKKIVNTLWGAHNLQQFKDELNKLFTDVKKNNENQEIKIRIEDDNIIIENIESESELHSISIFNIYGICLYSNAANQVDGNRLIIPVSKEEYPTGLYFCKFVFRDGIAVKKFLR